MLTQAHVFLKSISNESFVDKEGKTVNYHKAKCQITDRMGDTQTLNLSLSRQVADTFPKPETDYTATLELQFNDKGKVSACRIVGLE